MFFFFKYLLPLKQSFVIINKYGCKLSLIKQTKIKTVLLCYTTLSNKQEQSYTILFLWIQIKKKHQFLFWMIQVGVVLLSKTQLQT